jgi:hypothetical protein
LEAFADFAFEGEEVVLAGRSWVLDDEKRLERMFMGDR